MSDEIIFRGTAGLNATGINATSISDHRQEYGYPNQLWGGKVEVPNSHSVNKAKILWKPKFKLEYGGEIDYSSGMAVPDPNTGAFNVRLLCKPTYGATIRNMRARRNGYRSTTLNVAAGVLLEKEDTDGKSQPRWISRYHSSRRSSSDPPPNFSWAEDFSSVHGPQQTIHNFVKYVESADGTNESWTFPRGITAQFDVSRIPTNKWHEGSDIDVTFTKQFDNGKYDSPNYAPFFILYWVGGNQPESGSVAEQIGPTITRVYQKRLKLPSVIPVRYSGYEYGV